MVQETFGAVPRHPGLDTHARSDRKARRREPSAYGSTPQRPPTSRSFLWGTHSSSTRTRLPAREMQEAGRGHINAMARTMGSKQEQLVASLRTAGIPVTCESPDGGFAGNRACDDPDAINKIVKAPRKTGTSAASPEGPGASAARASIPTVPVPLPTPRHSLVPYRSCEPACPLTAPEVGGMGQSPRRSHPPHPGSSGDLVPDLLPEVGRVPLVKAPRPSAPPSGQRSAA